MLHIFKCIEVHIDFLNVSFVNTTKIKTVYLQDKVEGTDNRTDGSTCPRIEVADHHHHYHHSTAPATAPDLVAGETKGPMPGDKCACIKHDCKAALYVCPYTCKLHSNRISYLYHTYPFFFKTFFQRPLLLPIGSRGTGNGE